MVSRTAESEARAFARWKDDKAGPREGTGEIISLNVPLKRSKRRAIANLEREFIPH